MSITDLSGNVSLEHHLHLGFGHWVLMSSKPAQQWLMKNHSNHLTFVAEAKKERVEMITRFHYRTVGFGIAVFSAVALVIIVVCLAITCGEAAYRSVHH